MSRRRMVIALAPVAPPCFQSRSQWLEYLSAAAEAQSEKGQPAPLIFEAGKPVRFNTELQYCDDCEDMYAIKMHAQGRCKPGYLRDQPGPLTALIAGLKRRGT